MKDLIMLCVIAGCFMWLCKQAIAFTERQKMMEKFSPDELREYQEAMRDITPQVPVWKRALVIGLAIAYIVSPIDFIPDPLLGLGQLDDLAVGYMAYKKAIGG